MLVTLGPLQQLIIGVGIVGILLTVLVVYLTSSKNFKNTDRLTLGLKKVSKRVQD